MGVNMRPQQNPFDNNLEVENPFEAELAAGLEDEMDGDQQGLSKAQKKRMKQKANKEAKKDPDGRGRSRSPKRSENAPNAAAKAENQASYRKILDELIPRVAEIVDDNQGLCSTGQVMQDSAVSALLQGIPVGEERKLTKILRHYDEYFALLQNGNMIATSLAYQTGRVTEDGTIQKDKSKILAPSVLDEGELLTKKEAYDNLLHEYEGAQNELLTACDAFGDNSCFEKIVQKVRNSRLEIRKMAQEMGYFNPKSTTTAVNPAARQGKKKDTTNRLPGVSQFNRAAGPQLAPQVLDSAAPGAGGTGLQVRKIIPAQAGLEILMGRSGLAPAAAEIAATPFAQPTFGYENPDGANPNLTDRQRRGQITELLNRIEKVLLNAPGQTLTLQKICSDEEVRALRKGAVRKIKPLLEQHASFILLDGKNDNETVVQLS